MIGVYYDLFSGKSRGVAFGMLSGKSIVWRDYARIATEKSQCFGETISGQFPRWWVRYKGDRSFLAVARAFIVSHSMVIPHTYLWR